MAPIWNITDGTLVKSISGHKSKIYAFVRLSENKYASSGDDGTIKIWDTKNNILLEHWLVIMLK